MGGGTCSHDHLILCDFIRRSALMKPLVPKYALSSSSLEPLKPLPLFPIFVRLFYLLSIVGEIIIESTLFSPGSQQSNQRSTCFQKKFDNIPCSLKIKAPVPVLLKTPGRGSDILLLCSCKSWSLNDCRRSNQHVTFLCGWDDIFLMKSISSVCPFQFVRYTTCKLKSNYKTKKRIKTKH